MKACSAAFAAILLLVLPCRAQAPPRGQRADALQRWAEYQELMNASDPISRWEGLNRALADENTGVRNNALWTYIHKRDRLLIEIVLPPGSRIGLVDLPNLDINDIKWNEDQRALSGTTTSFNGRNPITGQVAAGKLRLRFSPVYMPAFLGQKDLPSSGKPEVTGRNCGTVLSVNETHDGLEGSLTCEGLSLALPLFMPLG